MADYTSFSSAPLPTRPYGPLTGLATADADFMQQQAQMRSLEDMFTANSQNRANLERYQGETPAKLAEAELARLMAQGKQGFVGDFIQGDVGAAKSKRAAGEEAMGTLEGKIGATNADNRTKAAQAQLQFLDARMPMLEQAAAQNPMAAQMVWDQMLKESGAPFPRQFDQTTLPNLKKIREHLVNSVTQQQELAKTKATGDQHARVAGIQGSNQLAVENKRQEGLDWRSQLDSEEKSRMKKLEEKLVEFATISTTRELTPQEQKTRNEIFQVMQMLAIARGAAGPMTGMQFLNPGAQPPQPQPFPGGGQPAPQGALQIQQQAIRAWGKYEPDKYEYGVNPQTGKFARKQK